MPERVHVWDRGSGVLFLVIRISMCHMVFNRIRNVYGMDPMTLENRRIWVRKPPV